MFRRHIHIFLNVLRTVNAFFTEPLGTSFVFLIIGLCITFLYQLFVNYVLIIGEMRFFSLKYANTKELLSQRFSSYINFGV